MLQGRWGKMVATRKKRGPGIREGRENEWMPVIGGLEMGIWGIADNLFLFFKEIIDSNELE